jgi:hypothetical protein
LLVAVKSSAIEVIATGTFGSQCLPLFSTALRFEKTPENRYPKASTGALWQHGDSKAAGESAVEANV